MQRYQMLNQDQIARIHETSLEILEEVGVVMGYAPARDVLAKHGAKVEGEIVYFPKALVEEKLKTVPESFTVYARNPKKNVLIDTVHTAFAGPYGAPYIQDLDNGRRQSTLSDFINCVKLCQMFENIDILGFTSCEPNDIENERRSNLMTYHNIKWSDKPAMGSMLGAENAKDSIEMTALAFGGSKAAKDKPIMFGIACSLSPLSYDDRMLGGLMAYAEMGQPLLISSLCIGGATSPSTIAGSIAVQNAEILAGIILAQAINPGTPIVYSASSSNADMRYGALSIGSPEDAIYSIVNGQLAKLYNIPCRQSGFLSDSKMMDSQSAYESAITGIMAQMAGGNFILHSGGILEAYNCLSLEKMVIDQEIVGMIKRIDRGIDVNDETLAFDVIKEVGPQGEYLSHMHTFAHFRDNYNPLVGDRQNASQWKAKGSLSVEQRANAKWKQMLEDYVWPELAGDLDTELKKYVDTH